MDLNPATCRIRSCRCTSNLARHMKGENVPEPIACVSREIKKMTSKPTSILVLMKIASSSSQNTVTNFHSGITLHNRVHSRGVFFISREERRGRVQNFQPPRKGSLLQRVILNHRLRLLDVVIYRSLGIKIFSDLKVVSIILYMVRFDPWSS